MHWDCVQSLLHLSSSTTPFLFAGTNGCSPEPVAMLKKAGLNPADAFVSDQVYTLQVVKYPADEARKGKAVGGERDGRGARGAMSGWPQSASSSTVWQALTYLCCLAVHPAELFLADGQ